jgi:ABC-2 type transport system permease protein
MRSPTGSGTRSPVRPGAWPSVRGIVARDLAVVRRSRAVMLPLVIVPVVLFAGLPVALALGLQLGAGQLSELAPLLAALPEDVRRQLGDGPLERQALVYVIEFQFASLFLVAPIMVAAVIAADSLAGEKERRTLEALLYTPTTDLELYVAKLMAPLVAAVVVSLAGYGLYVASANLVAGAEAGRLLAVTPLWLVVVLWLSPASAALGLGALVQVSARVRGFQEAYQVGGLIVLPVVALIVAQLAGVVFLDAPLALLIGGLVWLVAGAVVWTGYRAFRRERLLLSA